MTSDEMEYRARFIGERVAEDKEAAEAAQPGPWTIETREGMGGTYASVMVPFGPAAPNAKTGLTSMAKLGTQDAETAAHIARNDPPRALRAAAAKRAIVAACTRSAEADPDSPAGVLALAVLEAMTTEWEHPDKPFTPDWTIRPGVLLRAALEAQGKRADDLTGGQQLLDGTWRIDRMHANWIGDLLGTSPDMWLNAQRLYDAAILRGAKDTSEEHGP